MDKEYKKGAKIMNLDNKTVLTEFIHKDRFELNSYLTYIFNQLKDLQTQLEDK